jgi:hypothetical protein
VTITNATAFISVGGRDDEGVYSQLSLGYDTLTDALVETKTSLFFDRTAVAQAPDGTYWAFGGLDSTNQEHNILWTVRTNGVPSVSVWSSNNVASTGKASARKNAGLAWLKNSTDSVGPCVVILGGDNKGVKATDIWTYDLTRKAWRTVNTLNAPTPRTGAVVTSSPDFTKVYVIGGETDQGAVNDAYVLAPYGFEDATPAEMNNIALGKTASMSSVSPNWGNRGAGAANDNILNTNFNGVDTGAIASCGCNWCTESLQGSDQWWAVDLGSAQQVDFIYIYTRSDGWVTRNGGFQLWAGNTYSTVSANLPWNQPSSFTRIPAPTDLFAGGPNIVPVSGIKARYLWFYLPGANRILNLCEFQVWQKRPWVWRQLAGTFNAAFQRPAEQSGTLSGWGDGQAIRAVDGLTTNNFNQQPYTCSHTSNNARAGGAEWWLVDLGREYDVRDIDVWGRSDCCTGRNTNIQWYVGNSRDWAYNYRCPNAPFDITPTSVPGSIKFGCTARGRYVMAVKPVTVAGLDANMIQLWYVFSRARDTPCARRQERAEGSRLSLTLATLFAPSTRSPSSRTPLPRSEVLVGANRLLDMPSPRANMAFTTYGSSIVIFGGQDASGFRQADIRFFDMITNRWLPPFTPLGTPPVARAFSSFVLLPNSSAIRPPSNRFALFSGLSTNNDVLTDFNVLTFPQCPSIVMDGVVSLDCYNGGTMCYVNCDVGSTSANGKVPITCQPNGMWKGLFPVCRVRTSDPPSAIVATTVVNSTAILVSWNPPLFKGYHNVVNRYRAMALTGDVLERFNGGKFEDPLQWTQHKAYTGACPAVSVTGGVIRNDFTCTFTETTTTNTYDFYNGMLRLNGDLGKNTWFDQRDGLELIRNWPSSVNVAGSWAIETWMKLDTEDIVWRDSMMACIGLMDMQEYNNTGVLEVYAGLRKDGDGVFRVGLESSVNNFNNWFSTNGLTQAFVRMERDATFNPAVYRAYYKFTSSDQWIRMPVSFTDARLRNGGIRTQDLRPALAIRNWNGGSRAVASYSYIRIGPLTCGDPGTIRIVDRSITSALIYGLAPGNSYTFGVQAENPAGWSAVSAPSNAVIVPTLSAAATGTLRLVSQNKPCSLSTVYADDPANNGCQRAVDGNYATWAPILHTKSQVPEGEFLTIDLQFPTAVKRITIFNRNDCCIERIRNFEVYVGSSTTYSKNALCPAGLVPTSLENASAIVDGNIAAPNAASFPCELTGRYVTLKILPNIGWPWDGYLHIREMWVHAANSCPARGATGGTQVTGTSCAAGSAWGSICTHQCLPGFIPVAGSTSSSCDGEAWDAAELVCAPACPDLFPVPWTETCTQTFYAEDFNNANGTAFAKLLSLDAVTQKLGFPIASPPASSKWFISDGLLQAAARFSCASDLHSVIASQKIFSYQSAFVLTAKVSTDDRAGLIWRAQNRLNMYRFYLDVITNLHVVEKIVNGVSTKLSDVSLTLPANTFHTVSISQVNAQINITINDQLVLTTADRTFVVGYAGVYAQTRALFDDLSFQVPCSACAGATDQDTCTFGCQDGLISYNSKAYKCVQAGGLGAGATAGWVDEGGASVASPNLICTLPPPTFIPSVLRVRENQVKNTPVGDPLVGYSSSADFQLQWMITGPPDVVDLFYIDSCSGQVKQRRGGVGVLDYEIRNTYLLTVRAFIPGFVGAETFRNISISILNLDEAPLVISGVIQVNENAAVLGSGTFVWDNNAGVTAGSVYAWDPENTTIWYTLAVDGADGSFALDKATGALNISGRGPNATSLVAVPLSFESLPNVFTLQVQATQRNDTTMFGTGTYSVRLVDLNDPPFITRGQNLVLVDDFEGAGTNAGVIQAIDEDTAAFAGPITYTQVFGAEAAAHPECRTGSSATLAAWPSTDDTTVTTANALFAVNSTTGLVTVQRVPVAGKEWRTRSSFIYSSDLVRVVYAVCINVTDNFGGYDVQPVFVPIAADVPDQPVVRNMTGPTTLNTTGSQLLVFRGSGFKPSGVLYPLLAWYTNDITTYNGSACTIDSDSQISCYSRPGIGADHRWNFIIDRTPVLFANGADRVSYLPPSVDVVINATGIPTEGGSRVILRGNNFGPVGTPVSVTYGNALEFSCSYVADPLDSHTVVRCDTEAGVGQDLRWAVTVGGQVAASNAGGSTFGYAFPTITNIVNTNPGYTIASLDTAGGQLLTITGTNFGPLGVDTDPSYGITVSYGGTSGTMLPFTDCRQAGGAASHTTLTCKTVPGVGTDHPALVTVAGVAALAAWPNSTAAGLSYQAPVITRIYGPGAKNADTSGGQLVYIEGRHFGPVTFPIQTISFVSYGHFGDTSRYSAQACQVTSEPPQVSMITCATAEGVGRDHHWALAIAGQTANISALTSYAAPQIIAFSGVGAVDADTRGQQLVVLTGRNFGPADAYTNGLLYVEYGTLLQEGGFTNVTYPAAQCSIVSAHTKVECTTIVGAGKDLQWEIVLDGQPSANPTTNYHVPVVDSIVFTDLVTPVTAANVDGGEVVVLKGDFFGPAPWNGRLRGLVQRVSYGLSGSEYVVPENNWAVTAQDEVRVTLLPGVGVNLRFRVQVADQVSAASAGTFSYAIPEIVAISPRSASTYSNPDAKTVITLVTKNFPLLDKSCRYQLSFGQGAYTQTFQPTFPVGALAIASARDPITGTINASFALPEDHAGVGLGVKIDIFQGTSGIPVIATNVTEASVFSYADPVVQAVIVTRALLYDPRTLGNATTPGGDYVACPFPDADPVWSCADPRIVQLTLVGRNFAKEPALTNHVDGVERNLELLVRNFTAEGIPQLGELWASTGKIWLLEKKWLHESVTFFALQSTGLLRLTLTTPQTWTGDSASQVRFVPFRNVNPTVSAVRGAVNDVPCIGSTEPIEIEVENLAGASDLKVFVGGREAQIVVRSGSSWIPPPNGVVAGIVQAQSPPVWTVYALVPPGQGKEVSVQVVRYTLGAPEPSNTGFTINYAAPAITKVGVKLAGEATFTFADVSVTAQPAVTVPTDGTARVRVMGTNLGTAPVVVAGDSSILLPEALTPCWPTLTSPADNFTCWEFTSPEGEGDGTRFSDSELVALPRGYKLRLAAGNQPATPLLPWRYQAPNVTAVSSPDTGSFPTTGGIVIQLHGSNFGSHNPARSEETAITATFSVPGEGLEPIQCSNIVRLSHTLINCTLPEGSGRGLNVTLSVAGVLGGAVGSLWSYSKPVITRAYTLAANSNATISDMSDFFSLPADAVVTVLVPGVNTSTDLLRGPTVGGTWIVLEGENFGAADPVAHCAFLTWSNRALDVSLVHTCNDRETFLGEGEVPASRVAPDGGWSHTRIVFRANPGIGTKDVELSVRGNTLALPRFGSNLVRFRFDDPVITAIVPDMARPDGSVTGDTEGGEVFRIEGLNFGPAMVDTAVTGNDRPDGVWPPVRRIPLADAPALPTGYIVVVFHSSCIAVANDMQGRPERTASVVTSTGSKTLDLCSRVLISQDHTTIRFRTPPGVGANKNVTVRIVDAPVTQSSALVRFSYAAPLITSFTPSYVLISGDPNANEVVDVLGKYFGNIDLAVQQAWTDEERQLGARAGGLDCDVVKRRREEGETIISCGLSPARFVAGSHNFTVTVAGQTGFNPERPFSRALKIVCAPGAYAHANETCVPCPASFPENPTKNGATCRGYVRALELAVSFEASLTYPVPNPGWHNLNSSDAYTKRWAPGQSMMDSCPEGYQHYGRDVCVVPCDPPESCLGDNVCAYGYTSKPPMWRCASCDTGFYKRAGECIKCPDSPAALFIGFVLLVVVVGWVGYTLNKRQVNIAVISIGIDFFQVLAIFSQSRIKWPPIIKELLHVLSAFNLNIEIVAPECLIPDVSYKQKFWFIMLLPVSVGGLLLGGIFTAILLWKFIKGMPKKKYFTHTPTLVSCTLILFYMLYLYLTRTILDVFNCTPTMPPDGYTYLQVVFERCKVPGGTQMTLLPFAVAGLAVYTAGYPAFVGYTLWKNRELVMEDQLLRAKGVGNDRLTNPHAYEFRKQYGRSYFQFKPDLCLWILAIILRKFFIALTAVIFNKNPSFQMAACLLVMFVAYSAQMMNRPYMSPSEYDDVLKAHLEASFTSQTHARLRATLSNIETRGRKKARKNLINFEGKLDRSAILGVLSGWLFNYNTVEQLMLFAAVIVCLMGIMYQANEVNTYYPESKDSVTAVVLVVIIGAIVYFVTVLVTEIVVLYNEANREKQLQRLARSGKGRSKSLSASDGSSAAGGSGGKGKGKLVSDDGDINTGKLDTHMNPLFMNKDGGASLSADGEGIDAVLQSRNPPPPELWVLLQQGWADQKKAVEALSAQLLEAKRTAALGPSSSSGEGGDGDGGASIVDEEVGGASGMGAKKKSFAPRAAAGSSSDPMSVFKGANAGGKSFKSIRKTGGS